TVDELTDQEAKQIKADDQAIQTILMGLPEDIYAAVDSCQTSKEIWLRVEHMMKGSTIGAQEKKAKLFNEWEIIKAIFGSVCEAASITLVVNKEFVPSLDMCRKIPWALSRINQIIVWPYPKGNPR
nr:ribonuclease H-like domain-containing protein [Tanacetum cinerariifolium]